MGAPERRDGEEQRAGRALGIVNSGSGGDEEEQRGEAHVFKGDLARQKWHPVNAIYLLLPREMPYRFFFLVSRADSESGEHQCGLAAQFDSDSTFFLSFSKDPPHFLRIPPIAMGYGQSASISLQARIRFPSTLPDSFKCKLMCETMLAPEPNTSIAFANQNIPILIRNSINFCVQLTVEWY
jgi:hypothetical protein